MNSLDNYFCDAVKNYLFEVRTNHNFLLINVSTNNICAFKWYLREWSSNPHISPVIYKQSFGIVRRNCTSKLTL